MLINIGTKKIMKYSKGNVARADHNGHASLGKRMRESQLVWRSKTFGSRTEE